MNDSASDSEIMAKHWYDFAGSKRACSLQGPFGNVSGFIQFPLDPREQAKLWGTLSHPLIREVHIHMPVPSAIRLCLRAEHLGTVPEILY